jgi:carbon-monoxide dehydrogenase medium subunit
LVPATMPSLRKLYSLCPVHAPSYARCSRSARRIPSRGTPLLPTSDVPNSRPSSSQGRTYLRSSVADHLFTALNLYLPALFIHADEFTDCPAPQPPRYTKRTQSHIRTPAFQRPGKPSPVAHPVAVVVATHRYIACDAADLVEVDYEPSAAVADPEKTLAEALHLIDIEGDRKLLAGGVSLIPLMKLRLAQPGHLVDLARVPGLNGIEAAGGKIHVGAMATHHEVETSAVARANCPMLCETVGSIGDPQVRHRRAIGGSIAHADPAADYPAALLAPETQTRLVAAHRYEKVAHPASGFAVVGIAVRLMKTGGKIAMARIGVTGLASDIAAAAAVGEGIHANSNLYASAEYRLHLARVHAARALRTALSRAE